MADLRTKNPAHHEPAILQGVRRVRYLKLIALFKIGKGVLLLVAGASLLFLNTRARWMDALSNWTADEILLEHSRAECVGDSNKSTHLNGLDQFALRRDLGVRFLAFEHQI